MQTRPAGAKAAAARTAAAKPATKGDAKPAAKKAKREGTGAENRPAKRKAQEDSEQPPPRQRKKAKSSSPSQGDGGGCSSNEVGTARPGPACCLAAGVVAAGWPDRILWVPRTVLLLLLPLVCPA